MTDMRYGNLSSPQPEQGIWNYNSSPVSSLSSHLNLLEDFSPYRTSDPFHWIPQGLFYDMMDNRNDFIVNQQQVDVEVNGYSNQQMFNAFKNNIYNLPTYRLELIEQNPGNQSMEITNLFNQYGY